MKAQSWFGAAAPSVLSFTVLCAAACGPQALPCSQTPAALAPEHAPVTSVAASETKGVTYVTVSETKSVTAAGNVTVIEREVAAVLDAFHQAAAAANEEAYFALFARDGVFLGTDASERWDVAAFRAYAHPYFSTGRGWTYTPRDRHVSVAAARDLAWFDERLDHAKYGELRGSGVLVREALTWKVAQYNLTFTVPNAAAGEVVDLLRKPRAP